MVISKPIIANKILNWVHRYLHVDGNKIMQHIVVNTVQTLSTTFFVAFCFPANSIHQALFDGKPDLLSHRTG